MKYTIYFALILCCLSCSQKLHEKESTKILFNPVNSSNKFKADTLSSALITKDTNTSTVLNDYNVRIQLTHYFPYCGGAAPNESQQNNFSLLSNTDFLLINLNSSEKTTVHTDSSGYLTLKLEPGHYGIQEIYKDCSFEEFMQRVERTSGNYFLEMDETCYKDWWKKLLGEFKILGDENLELKMSTSSACFTGTNPCLMYTGPDPP
jgi:hypothetical protein